MGNGKQEMGQSDYRNNIGVVITDGRKHGPVGHDPFTAFSPTFTSPLHASLSIII